MNRMPSLSPSSHPNRVLIRLFQCLLAASLGTAAGEEMTWIARAGYGATDVEGRHHPITFANETHGFLFSGGSRRSGATKDFYLYDEANDEWTDLTDTVGNAFPGPARSFAYGIVLNEADHPKAYLGFGVGPSDERLADWWELDMRTYEWKELASLPGLGRRHPAMNPVKKSDGGWEIHVGLGDGILNADDPENSRFSNLNDWFVYDVDDDSWEQMPDLPSSRRHHPFYFGLGSSSYAGLGHSDGYRPYIERDWYKFDHDTKTWTQETDFASYEAADDGTYPEAPVTTEARVAGAQFAIDLPLRSTDPLRGSLGFVLSGDGDNHYAIATGEFQAFYPEGSDLDAGPVGDGKSWWRQLPPHPGYSRWAPGSFVMRGSARAYFTSGYDRVYQRLHADLWMIDLSPLFAENPVAPEATDPPTDDPTASPTASPTDSPTADPSLAPTAAPTDPLAPKIMVQARIYPAENNKGAVPNSYYSKSKMGVQFMVDGEWTESAPLFDSCAKTVAVTDDDGNKVCPAAAESNPADGYANYGPFDSEPTSVKITIAQNMNRKGTKLMKLDNFFAGNLDMKMYNEGADPSTATEKCVAEKWDSGFWMGHKNSNILERTYTPVETCPCEPFDLTTDLRLNPKVGPTRGQRMTVELYLPCSKTWWSKSFPIAKTVTKNSFKIKKGGSPQEYPTKMRVTLLTAGPVELKSAFVLFKPKKQVTGALSMDGVPELAKGESHEWDITYTNRRLETTNHLEEMFELETEFEE